MKFRSENERLVLLALLAAGTEIINSKFEQWPEGKLGERLLSIYQDMGDEINDKPTLGDFIAQAKQMAEGRRSTTKKPAKTVTWRLRPVHGPAN